MAISVISVSSDSSEGSVRTPAGRVILFGTIPTTIPETTSVITPPTSQTGTTVIPTETPVIAPTILPSLDYTPALLDYSPASPDYSPASDTESDPSEDPSSVHIPPLQAISPFLYRLMTPQTRSPVIPRRRVMILAPRQPIPHGRPYRYHPNGPVHMMTARKRVGPLPVQQLAVIHFVDHASSDYFSPDDSARDSSSNSSFEASSDFHSDASFDSSSRHSLSDHSSPDLPSTSAGPSHVEDDPKETSLRDDVMVRGSDKPYLEQDIDSKIQTEIDECFAYAYALRDRGIDARVVVEAVDREESETGTRGSVEVRVERVTYPVMPEDTPEPAQEERAVKCTYETLRSMKDKGRRIVGVKSVVTVLTERIAELEKDNRRLRDTVSVESQRVDRFQHSMSPEEMEAREAAMNLKPLNENGDEQEGENGGNGNGGNGENKNRGNRDGGNGENGNKGNRGNRDGNRNMNHSMNYGGLIPVARECTFQDFLECKPHNFSGTEGVVGLTRWFEKIETVFNISNCPPKYQVKYVTYTLQDSALTWWNSHKRTIGVDAAHAIKWVRLVKLMTEVYCPRNEIQIETELWNLTGYAARSAKNKRGIKSKPRDNRGQQPPFKRQHVSGQNVARVYTAGNKEMRGYTGPHPLYNKCRYHHVGPCTVRCGNCKKSIICYECGRPGYSRKDCPKLRNQNRGNKTRNRVRNKTGNQTRGNEATARAYAIGGGGTNPECD
nr:putative retrotransposon Gag domain-containing protein [Tanacetum cinerariifolium]